MDDVNKRVLLDLLLSPWTVLPVVAGLTSLMISWGAGGAAFFNVLGVASILAGIGALATNWIVNSGKIIRKALQALQAEAIQKQQDALDELDRRLQQDKDPRSENSLRELRRLYDGFKENKDWSRKLNERSAFEITNKVEKLFRGCIISLERSLQFWETASKMNTPDGRASVLQSRERILEEVHKSVGQLARTLDGIHRLAIEQSEDHNLTRIRQDLDESLEVARRVEERMQSLETELGRTVLEAERE